MIKWSFLLGLTSLIHPYLLAMVAAVCMADTIQRLMIHKDIRVLMGFACGISITLLVMWSAGYFMINGFTDSGGFTMYRMNLYSLINSYAKNPWSIMLPQYKPAGIYYEWEGFNYLGTGMILLSIWALFHLIKNIRRFLRPRFLPLFVMCMVLFLYAVSNRIAIGPYEIISYEIPGFFEFFTQAFRASGRFFWIISYLIYFISFYFIIKKLRRSLSITILAILLLLQVFDSQKPLLYLSREWFSRPPVFSSPLRSQKWREIAEPYDKIILVPPANKPENWKPLLDLAAMNNMAVNFGCFARVDGTRLKEARDAVSVSIINNRYNNKALYIFSDAELWVEAKRHYSGTDYHGIQDGIRFLAPGFFKTDMRMHNPAFQESVFPLNEAVFFRSMSEGSSFTLNGWASPEENGIWSDSREACLSFKIPEFTCQSLLLIIESYAFVNEQHCFQEIDMYIGNNYLATLKYTLSENRSIRSILIPGKYILSDDPSVMIRFRMNNPVLPYTLGLSGDKRRLGIFLISMELSTVLN